MTTDQPQPQPDDQSHHVVAYFEQFFATIIQAYERTGDPAALVFDNYVRWKGLPADAIRLEDRIEHLSPYFSVLEYPAEHRFAAYCTLGASYQIIPGSQQSFGDPRGVRHEYILHAIPDHAETVMELLIMVSEYPFKHDREVGPGFVLPIGEPVVEGSHMEYLYFSYPFMDEPDIYHNPRGQIDREDVLVQTLWVFPIYKSEVDFIRERGPEAFEELCYAKHTKIYDADDFMRLPYV
ncbi:MAG: hypothetical protein OHK0022_44160 [Roseiflexaceae bacterium]